MCHEALHKAGAQMIMPRGTPPEGASETIKNKAESFQKLPATGSGCRSVAEPPRKGIWLSDKTVPRSPRHSSSRSKEKHERAKKGRLQR